MAESALEDAAYVLARALANHFKKTGDLDRHGKVDVTKTEIVKLRTQELVNKTTAIRDVGTAAGAAGRGVTAARVAALTAAITAFSSIMRTPRRRDAAARQPYQKRRARSAAPYQETTTLLSRKSGVCF